MKHYQKHNFYNNPTWTKILLLSLFISLVAGKIQLPPIKSISIIQNTASSEDHSALSSSYTAVDQIIIGNAEDWGKYSFITGTGTQDDPYIIEGIEIAGNDSYYEGDPNYFGIAIGNNDASVIIRDCYIHHFHAGIYFGMLNEMIPQRIERNIIEYCGLGISIFIANVTINNNYVSECHAMAKNLLIAIHPIDPESAYYYGGVGIYTSFASGFSITSNYISNCDIGAAHKNPCIIKHNQFTGCGLLLGHQKIYQFNLENNSVNGLPLGYYTDFNYNQTESEPIIFDGEIQQFGQLIILGLENVVIKNMNIQDTTLGYQIDYNHNLTISNCIADNCLFGMFIFAMAPLEVPAEFLEIHEIRILNCYIGIQISTSSSKNERRNLNISIGISEFTNNQFDIFMAYWGSSPFSMTVPIGSTVYLDFYWNYRFQVSYNGSILNSTDPQLQNQSSPYSNPDDEFNATVLHLNHLGQYHILLEIQDGDEWLAYWNVTINTFEVPPDKKSIEAYTGLWLSSSIGISLVCTMIYLKKRRFVT